MKRRNVNLLFVILIISFSVIRAQDDEDFTTEEYADTDDDATSADDEYEEPEITTRAPTRRPVTARTNPNKDFVGNNNNNGACSICAYLNTIRAPSGRGGGRYNSDYNYSYSNGRYTRRNIRRRRNGNYRNSNSRNDQRWRQSSWSRYAKASTNYDDDYYYYDDNSLSSNSGNRGRNRNSFGNCRDGACNLRSYFNSYYNARNSDQARKSNTYQRCLWTVGNIGYF